MSADLFIENGPAAIIAAALITYCFRFGGLLLADRLPRTGPLRIFLDALPGTILVSLVVPSAVHSGWQGWSGLAAWPSIWHTATAADDVQRRADGVPAASGELTTRQ